MPTKAMIVNTTLTEWSADGVTYATIPEATVLVVPTTVREYVEATNLDSNGFREYVPGLQDAGEITLPANYTPDLNAQANTYSDNGTLVYFRTTLPLFEGQATSDVFTFRGYVTPSLQTNSVGEIIKMDMSIRISGKPVYTQGTAA